MRRPKSLPIAIDDQGLTKSAKLCRLLGPLPTARPGYSYSSAKPTPTSLRAAACDKRSFEDKSVQ